MDTLLIHTRDILADTHHETIWLGVSGGIDSMVLMHVCKTLYNAENKKCINVVYINHQLHPESQRWGEFVKCKAYEYNFIFHTIAVECNKDTAIEETARNARYQAIFSLMKKQDILLTAHHYDDQKETVLFRLLRGTSPKGLMGMQHCRKLSGFTICRPLLNCTKSSIVAYAKKHHIEYIEDSSNASMAYTRNRIRKAIKLIDVQEGINTSQMHLRRHLNILDELLDPILQSVCILPHILCFEALSKYSLDIQHEVFYRFLFNHLGDVSHTKLIPFFNMLRYAKQDKYPCAQINDQSIIRYRNTITILVLPETYHSIFSSNEKIDLMHSGYIENPNGQQLSIKPLVEKGRYKKLFQQKGIPSWLRGYIPMINDQIIFDYDNVTWVPPKLWQYWIS